MSIIFKDIMDKMYPWFFHAAGGVIIVAMAVFFYYTFWGINKFSTAISNVLKRDDRIKELQDKLDEEKEKYKASESVANQVSTALFNIRPFIETLTMIRTMEVPEMRMSEAANLIQRMLDQLASDIKFKSGEVHRCGVWIITELQALKLQIISSGFPRNYKGVRELDINRSIAGKTYRKKQKIRLDDVNNDTDWEKNPESRSLFKSLICVPLGDWGVLTIDGLRAMSEECELIGELYAVLIESAAQEYDHGFFLFSSKQSLDFQPDVV